MFRKFMSVSWENIQGTLTPPGGMQACPPLWHPIMGQLRITCTRNRIISTKSKTIASQCTPSPNGGLVAQEGALSNKNQVFCRAEFFNQMEYPRTQHNTGPGSSNQQVCPPAQGTCSCGERCLFGFLPFNGKRVRIPGGLLPPSVVLKLILDLRPDVFIPLRIQRGVFVYGPQITEGIVLRLFRAPRFTIAAPCGMPAAGFTAAAARGNPFTSCHPFSSPSTGLPKIKFNPLFLDKKICTCRAAAMARQEGPGGSGRRRSGRHRRGEGEMRGHAPAGPAAIHIPADQRS